MAGTAGKSIEIYLYLLERADTANSGEWSSCIVASSTESGARQTANEEAGAEGYLWTDGFKVNAKKIGIAEEGVSGILMHATE